MSVITNRVLLSELHRWKTQRGESALDYDNLEARPDVLEDAFGGPAGGAGVPWRTSSRRQARRIPYCHRTGVLGD
jgi:hypothetical protein